MGVLTDQPGFLAGQFYDTNLLKFKTNYFQCYDIMLTNGLNTVTLHATFAAGETVTTNVSFTLDYSGDVAPAIQLTWPQDGASVAGNTFTLRGILDDPTAQVSVSGLTDDPVNGEVGRDGRFWVENLPLTSGDNTLTLTATDAAGNSSTTNITVFASDVTLAVNPLTDDDLRQSSATVMGTISDSSYDVWVNGVEAYYVDEAGDWEADGVPVNNGSVAAFDVTAYPPGEAPAMKGYFHPLDDGGGGTTVSQSLVEEMPSLVLVSSYQNGYYQNSMIVHYCDGTETGGVDAGSESWMPGDSDAPPAPPWPQMSGSYFYSASGVDAQAQHCSGLGAVTISESWGESTSIELAVGGQPQSGEQRLVLLTAQASDTDGNPISPSSYSILGQSWTAVVANDDGSISGQTLVNLPAGAVRNITPSLPVNGTFNVQPQDVPLQLAVDANRDGNITFDAADQTTAAKPYRFWVNNDHDGYDSSISDYADLDPSTGSDANNIAISCTRDLEDYTRLWINTQGITDDLQSGNLLLALQWKDAVGYPGIRIFAAVETPGGTLYLTDETTAQAQTNTPYGNCLNGGGVDELQGSLPFFIPTNIWANLSADQPVAHLLFDAIGRGSGQLVVSIYKNDRVTKIAESPQPLYLKLQDVKEMYERYTVGDNPSSAPATTASLVTTPYSYDSTIPAENNYIPFVHGWNLAPWERDAFAETAFKRLYWQGYKGHFGAFQWPTEYGFTWESIATDPHNYNNSESNAWASATGLLGKLNDLNANYPSHVYLMAHSMGNVVAGEALKLAGSSQVVNTYVAMQGAVPAHCYDPNATTRTIPFPFDSGTPNRYANYYTSGAPCYFNGTAGAGSYINFYNEQDWALGYWQDDQNLKPQNGYGYNTMGQFYRGTLSPVVLDFPDDTHEIFAYCDEARCFALAG